MKEKTIEILKEIYEEYSKKAEESAKKRAIKVAIQSLEQEPFINKECISINVCKHDKEAAIKKIKEEIRHNSEHFINDDGEDCLALYEDDVIEIINKYTESEENNGKHRINN